MEEAGNDFLWGEIKIPVQDWHKELLDARQRQIEAGKAKFVDWETAKTRIRDRVRSPEN